MAPERKELNSTADQSGDELTVALQELRALRPLLRDAADYAETAYLRSEKKDEELDNVRDYAVSMLVNLVDRLGTVAHQVATDTARQGTQLELAELHVASLQQRLQACWEYSGRDGLNRLQMGKAVPRLPKSYALPNAIPETRGEEEELPTIIRESFDFGPSSPTDVSSEGEASPRTPGTSATQTQTQFSTSWSSGSNARRAHVLPLLSLSENTGNEDSHSRETLNCLSLAGQFGHTLSPPSSCSSPSTVHHSSELVDQDQSSYGSKTKFTRHRNSSAENTGKHLARGGGGPNGEDYFTASDSPGTRKKGLLGGIFGRRRARSVPITRDNTVAL